MTSEGRFTRFGFNVIPDGLDHYTNAINFNRDVVNGAHDRDLLIGVIHVAVFQRDDYAIGERDNSKKVKVVA